MSAFVHEYGPILILFDDIHLFDTISLWLLAEAVEQLGSSCLVIATRRPDSGIFEAVTTSQVISLLYCCLKSKLASVCEV